MSTWTDRIQISFPVEHIDLANRLAEIIDPDIGGAETFSLDNQIDGRIVASIPFLSDFLPVVEARDPETWFSVMTELAESRNREVLTREEIDTLCETMLIGNEVQSSE